MISQIINSICLKFKISAICVIFNLNLARRQMSTQSGAAPAREKRNLFRVIHLWLRKRSYLWRQKISIIQAESFLWNFFPKKLKKSESIKLCVWIEPRYYQYACFMPTAIWNAHCYVEKIKFLIKKHAFFFDKKLMFYYRWAFSTNLCKVRTLSNWCDFYM